MKQKLIIVNFLLFFALLFFIRTNKASIPIRPWGTKPLLSHYLLNPGTTSELLSELDLSEKQLQMISNLAVEESIQLNQLELSDQDVLSDPNLSIDQKQAFIQSSGYNQKVLKILSDHQKQLRHKLGKENYQRLVAGIERLWNEEQSHQHSPFLSPALPQPLMLAKQYPRSYEVWATRYDAGGRYIIALPDKCLKFANGGAMRCSDGYQYNQNYSVAISYKGKIVVAPVLEAGPWNIDDNYWATLNDPQPRRMFADLPLGIPEAHAAYYNGYNGGLDQFGRLVKSPVAIDISWAVSKDLDLPPGNTKVTVSFLWTEGWDAPRSNAGEGSTATGDDKDKSPPAPAVITWATSTPNPDGSVIHIVQSGQTLIGIATVYEVPLEDVLALNNFTINSVIQPGDLILVKAPLLTPTPLASPSASPLPASRTLPPDTPSPTPTSPPLSTMPAVTPTNQQPATASTPANSNQFELLDYILIAFILVSTAVVATILWRSRRIK